MDQNQFLNEFSIPNRRDELLLDSEMTGWQPFSTPNKFQVQKQFLNSQVLQRTPTKGYDENGPVGFPHEQNQLTRRLTPSPDYQKTDLPENIINTDFLSAIPYARQSKTVKRKLNYEDNEVINVNDTLQKPKTYFPFEFIGHASRQSVSRENCVVISNKENERRLSNPTMITGRVLRKADVNGSVFETAFSIQNGPPLPQRKRAKKHSSKSKTNSMVALEQHFEQIRRKHAEFNWDVPDSQNNVTDEGLTSTEVDIQCVPTTPFIEQYTSPSLYLSNETPLQTSMSWMPASRLAMQNIEQLGRNQRPPTNVYSNSELWSTYTIPTQEFQDSPCGSTHTDHLYPY